MKDALTYANEAGFFSFNVVGWKAEFERLIEAVRADALAEQGCDYCNNTLFAGTSCPNCWRVVEPDHSADAGNKVPDHIAASGKVILTEEQAQQIEEALDELRYANNTDIAKTKYYKALSTIRAARAQEQAEQEPIGMILGGELVALVEECQTGAWPIYAAPAQPVSQQYQDHLVNQSFDWAAMAAKHQFMEGYRIGLAEMREKCATVVTEHAPTCSPHWVSYVVAIRAIKFEGDTGFRPVSEMIAEHKQDPKKAAAIEKAKMRKAEQEPVRKRCKRCNDTGLVSDGEIDNIGGAQLEVPIECVRDCPDCAAPQPVQEPTDCPCCGAKGTVIPSAFCRECKSDFWPPSVPANPTQPD